MKKYYVFSLLCLLISHVSPSFSFERDERDKNESQSLFYGRLYPEWRVDRFFGGSPAGSDVGHMGTLRNDTTVLSRDTVTKNHVSDWEWSNSYVGLRQRWRLASWSVGYKYELYVDTVGEADPWTNLGRNLNKRNAYAYVDHSDYGWIALGQMDSLYKAWGDRYRMLGISAGNFISTARIISSPGWRGSGDTSFHNRRANTLAYVSPRSQGWQVGSSYSFNESDSGPGGAGTQLWAYGVRYSDSHWYWALAEEWHYGWLPISQGVISPSSTSLRHDAGLSDSQDRATRLSMGWRQGGFRIGADVARLRYSETTVIPSAGKFSAYRNWATQVTVQQRINPSLSLAFSYAIASPGQCELTAGVACSTHGLGGYQMNAGAMYHLNRQVGLFALVSEIKNRPASLYGQASQGSDILSYAAGVLWRFD
jgi:predicted porin